MSDRGIVWKDRARKWREKDKCKRPSQSILLFLISFSSSASPVAVSQRVRMDCRLWKRDNLYLPNEWGGQANTQWIRTACGSLCQRHGNNYRPPKSIHTEGQWRNGCVGPGCASAHGFRVALTTRQMDPANNPAKISEFRHIIAAGQY